MQNTSLGTYLRNGREEAELTLEAVSLETRIPRRLLEALEEERYDDLPAMIYVRGFVRNFCRSVGIDPTPAVELLPRPGQPAATTGAIAPSGGGPAIYVGLGGGRPAAAHRGLRISHFVMVCAALLMFVAAYVIVGSRDDVRGQTADASATPATTIHQSVPAVLPAAPERDISVRTSD